MALGLASVPSIGSPVPYYNDNFTLYRPVAFLTGTEFLPVEGLTFAQQVLNFFVSQGGVAQSPFGPVLLDKKGIQSD